MPQIYCLKTEGYGDRESAWLSTLMEEAESRPNISTIKDKDTGALIAKYDKSTGWTRAQ